MTPKDAKYIPLSQYDTGEGESPCHDSPRDAGESLAPPATWLKGIPNAIRHWEWVIHGILLLLSVVFFTLWITSAGMHRCTFVKRYSPANEAIDYLERVKYRGALHFTTPWRGDEYGNPSSDIDAAWRRISTDVKPIRVTAEQLHEMGMAVTPTTVKAPGGGYLASLEVTHHLQCLDTLRKATYQEYYGSFDPAFQIEDEALTNQFGKTTVFSQGYNAESDGPSAQYGIDTCIELLRQALMCYPDINMVPYYWVQGRKIPVPDSNTIHRCKDFDKILDWAARKAVDDSRISSFHAESAEDGATAGM